MTKLLCDDILPMSKKVEAEIDLRVATLLQTKQSVGPSESSDDEDALLAELEQDDSVIDGFREKRMQQLHDEYVGFFALAATTQAEKMKNSPTGWKTKTKTD